MKPRLWIIMMMFSLASYGQDDMTFPRLDSASYSLYQEGRWNELIDLGEKGIAAGFDYYFLRMRLGIAQFKLNRYQDAIEHFRKALQFNEYDPVALEYLYYSLLWSGRSQEASLLAEDMPDATREKLGAGKPAGISGMFFEGGQVRTSGVDSLISFKPAGPYVYHYLLRDYSYLSGGLSFNPGERVSLTLGINRMKFSALQEVSLAGILDFDFDLQNFQTGLYACGEFILNPSWYIGLAGQFITGDFNYMAYSTNMAGQGEFGPISIDYSDYVLEASLQHRHRTLLAGLSLSYYDLGNQAGIQSGLGFTWYPLGNLNLYLQAQADLNTPLNDPDGETTGVVQGLAGFKVFKKLWLEGHAGYGRMASWSEKSAYIVYNNQDPILFRAGSNITIPDIVKGLSLTFRYQYQQREHSWEIWDGVELAGLETKKYYSNSLIGGITWKF